MGYKYRVCPFKDGNNPIVEINCIRDNTNSDINIDKSRLDSIPYDDENKCLIGCKCNKYKQWEIVSRIKHD